MNSGQAVSICISDEVRTEIERTMQRTGRDFSSVADELLTEAVKMRRVPGIIFADEPSGRAPWVAGTGIEVYEIISSYRDMGESWERLQHAFDWLTEQQLRAALAYAAAYPEEIEERWRREADWSIEEFWAKYPFTRPKQV